jgi:hypothetical protein
VIGLSVTGFTRAITSSGQPGVACASTTIAVVADDDAGVRIALGGEGI